MNILHVIRTLDPKTGGPVSVVRGMTAAQAQLGHRVTVVYEDAEAEGVESWDEVRLVNLAAPSNGPASLRTQIEQERPDAVHLHGVWCGLIRRAARLAIRLDLPYVVSLHGALGGWSMAQKPWKKRVALALVYRRLLVRARALVTSNENEEADLRRLGLRKNAVLVPYGLGAIDVELADAERTPEPTILFLGRLTWVKDPILLVDAFEILARVHSSVGLVVAGPDEGHGDSVAERVERLAPSIRERVTIPGPLFGWQKYEALRRAWVLCLPSRHESFGMVLVEAMAQGTPVVCSPECGFSQIELAGAGAVAARSPEQLAHALSGYLDLGRSQAAGDRGRNLVLERYLWPSIVAQHLRLYGVGTGPA